MFLKIYLSAAFLRNFISKNSVILSCLLSPNVSCTFVDFLRVLAKKHKEVYFAFISKVFFFSEGGSRTERSTRRDRSKGRKGEHKF